MSHDNRSREEDSSLFMEAAAFWIPLDELISLWAAFGREGTTAAATRVTSAAFAALAEEREALHAYIVVEGRSRTKQGIQAVGRHQGSIEALSLAATYWYDMARALEEHSEQCLQGELSYHGVVDEPADMRCEHEGGAGQ